MRTEWRDGDMRAIGAAVEIPFDEGCVKVETFTSDIIGTEPATKDSSAEPKAPVFRVLIAVWGQSYIDLFCKVSLPALLASGNLPMLTSETDCEVVFLTTANSVSYYERNVAYQALTSLCRVSFIFIDDLVSFNNYGVTLTAAYARGIKSLGEKQVGAYFVFLNADFVLSGNAYTALLAYVRRGHAAILAPSLRCNQEEVFHILARKVDPIRHSLDMPSRSMVEVALRHIHPTVGASVINRSVDHHSAANQFYWYVDRNTLVGRSFLLFMLCIRVERPMVKPSGFCDYTFIPDLCPSGNWAVVKDSDELFIMEMQATRGEVNYIELGKLSPSHYAKQLSVWTTREHRAYAAETLVFHASDIPSHIREVRREVDLFMKNLESALRTHPRPYKKHPFWLSALNGVRRKADITLFTEDIDWPSGRNRLRVVMDKFFGFLWGSPPFVGPFHPAWPDYRTIARTIDTLKRRSLGQGIYIRGGENPVDRLVARLPSIADTVTVGELIAGKKLLRQRRSLDFCVLSLSVSTIEMLWPVLGMLAPHLSTDAPIVVFFEGPHDGTNITADFAVVLRAGFSAEVSSKIIATANGTGYWAMPQLRRYVIQLSQHGIWRKPWLVLRIGRLCFRIFMMNLAGFLRPRSGHHKSCTSIVAEFVGDWSHPSWHEFAARAASVRMKHRISASR